jgi:hypothetical protein
MKRLESVQQHGAINLIKYVWTDDNRQIGPNTENVPIERRMVQLAQSNAIHDDWRTALRIRNNMSRLNELGPLQPTNCAMILVCGHDFESKAGLMDTRHDNFGSIGTLAVVSRQIDNAIEPNRWTPEPRKVQAELALEWMVLNNIRWKEWEVSAGHNSNVIDNRQFVL